MAGRGTDRKNVKGKEEKEPKEARENISKVISDMKENLARFTLPESLPCSEVEFPVLINKRRGANWAEILEERRVTLQQLEEYVQSKNEPIIKSPFQKTEGDFIKTEIFVYLLPALEETLRKAILWNVIFSQRCFFNGVDHLSQLLWNNNPRHPRRKEQNLYIFNMPWVRKFLKTHPRPLYPKSWLWTENYAATLIQKTLRQYYVQREEEVQEMREFWKKLELERDNNELLTNPFLAKKFASMSTFQKKKP